MVAEATVLMEDCQIIFRNFAGKEGPYNKEGDRSFSVLLPEHLVGPLEQDGWNVKYLKPRNEDDYPQAHLSVAVGYKYRPPKIVMITERGRTDIPEEMLPLLDWVDIDRVDLIIRPYTWSVRGEAGIKAYVKTLLVYVLEDALERKIADIPEIGKDEVLAIESGGALPWIEGEVVE